MGLLHIIFGKDPPREKVVYSPDYCTSITSHGAHEDEVLSKDILESTYEQMDAESRRAQESLAAKELEETNDFTQPWNCNDFVKTLIIVVKCKNCGRLKTDRILSGNNGR